MRHVLWILALGFVATPLAGGAAGDEAAPPEPRPLDVRKAAIEGPVKRIIAPGAADQTGQQPAVQPSEAPIPQAKEPPPEADRRDVHKFLIERPLEELVEGAAAAEGDPQVNPRVEPGKVAWHEDFAAACRAAESSGKPVLLFQLMGQLDQRFT